MAVTVTVYNKFKQLIQEGGIDLSNGGDTIKVMLVTSSYTPDIDTHDYKDDITNEVSHANYTAGGETLANQATSVDNTDDEGVFDADDVTWTNVTFTTRYGVIYKDSGVASTSPVIAYIDFGADQSPSGNDFKLTWNSEGILNFT